MIRVSTYFLLILIWFLGLQASYSAKAQETSIGISWNNPPDNPIQLSTQLATFKNIGIQLVELKHPVKPALLDSISNYPFQVFIRFDKKYLTASKTRKNRDEIVKQYHSMILEYEERESVIAYGLYSFSQSFNAEFIEEFEQISNELSQISTREFYEITSGPFNALNFSIYEVRNDSVPKYITAFIFSKEGSPYDARILNKLFNDNTRLILFDSDWLADAIEIHPYLLSALQNAIQGEKFILPLQKSVPTQSAFNWPVLVFVILWVSMGVHVAISQTYKPLIFRYFTGHRFFVDDVMRYRERSYVSGVFLFFQHALFTGLVVYIFSALLISKTGLNALFTAINELAIFGQNYFSLFSIGVLISIFVQLIALAWLYFPSKSMSHFSQALTLFTWVFHLDFLIVSIMLILLITGGSTNFIIFLGFLFIINWLVAFFLTSWDSSKYLMQKRIGYMLYTFGLHSLVNIAILFLVFSSNTLTDFLELIIVL